MGHPNSTVHRGGPDPVKIALRGALGVYVWQHMRKYPTTWFSAVELARVIRLQYIGDPKPPSVSDHRWGRSNVVASILAGMLDAGEIECRPRPAGPAKNAREWKWKQ